MLLGFKLGSYQTPKKLLLDAFAKGEHLSNRLLNQNNSLAKKRDGKHFAVLKSNYLHQN